MAKGVGRVKLEAKQRERVEVEARTTATLETQTASMNKIVEDTKTSLREAYVAQMRAERYAEYDKVAGAHRRK